MKTRKDHAITAIKGDAQPTRLIGLAVTAECSGEADGLGWQRESLVSWSSSGWARTKDGEYRCWSVTHGDVERWWRAIMWGAKRPGVTWVVAMRAVRVASILGLWSMIERGEIQWDGQPSDPTRRKDVHGGMRRVRSAAGDVHPDSDGRDRDAVPCVPDHERTPAGLRGVGDYVRPVAPSAVALDDPPTVVRLRVPGLPGRLLLLDCRNWGFETPESLTSAADESRWIADAMRRMVDHLDSHGWGGLKATAGSQALATWRRKFMTHEVVAHAQPDILELEKAAFVGGRCECGRLGEIQGPLYMVDRRSAYAAAAFDLSIPCRIRGRLDYELSAIVGSPERAGRCIAEAYVEGSEPAYPSSGRHGVRYPSGRRFVTLAGPELRDAIERGAVRRLGRCVEYDCAPALNAYAAALWSARRAAADAGDHAKEGWLKRLLVGLPGKLGQRVFDWKPEPGVCPPAPWYSWWGISREREIYRLRALGGAVQRQERGDWAYDSVPAAACWILSHARVALLQAIRCCGWDHCLYWDTDSLLLDPTGYDRIRAQPGLCGDGLGQWRLVRVVQRAVIHGPKYYEHDGAITCAGMPRADTSATRLQDRYWYRQSFGQSLLEGHEPRAGRRLRTYSRAPKYTLGRVGDGGRVYPFNVKEW